MSLGLSFPPLYLCPDCEGNGVIMYAGKVVLKVCSVCEDRRRTARTGFDRATTGADRHRSLKALIVERWLRGLGKT